MAVNDSRPFYLNLFKIRLPIPGVVSIMHRISGVLLFIAIPFLTYLFDLSLQGELGFNQAADILNHPVLMLVMLLLLWSLIHHLFAGVRYFLIEFDIGIEKDQSRTTAWVVIALEVIVLAWIVAGVCL